MWRRQQRGERSAAFPQSFAEFKVKKCKGFECSSIAKYFHVIATNRKRIMVTSVDFWKN